jgi:hypothetical protein
MHVCVRARRYMLLLTDLLKNTLRRHRDADDLRTALKEIQSIMDISEKTMSRSDELQKIIRSADRCFSPSSSSSFPILFFCCLR